MTWLARKDPATNRTYWCNKATGESSWTKPTSSVRKPVPTSSVSEYEDTERAARALLLRAREQPAATPAAGLGHCCTCGAQPSVSQAARAIVLAGFALAGAVLWPMCSWRARFSYLLLSSCFVLLKFHRERAFTALVLACSAFLLELDAVPTSPRTSTTLLLGSVAMLGVRMLPVWLEWASGGHLVGTGKPLLERIAGS